MDNEWFRRIFFDVKKSFPPHSNCAILFPERFIITNRATSIHPNNRTIRQTHLRTFTDSGFYFCYFRISFFVFDKIRNQLHTNKAKGKNCCITKQYMTYLQPTICRIHRKDFVKKFMPLSFDLTVTYIRLYPPQIINILD